MKQILFLTLFASLSIPGFSQNAAAPAYLTTQDFPDSVRSLGMETPDGSRLNFGEMLRKYEGKKILLDIWGSWCRDCIIGYPKLDQLRQEVGEQDVVYVFLSTDKDSKKWKNAIEKFDIRGEHYLMDGAWKNSLSGYIVLDWVPRYLVLDEAGRIIIPKAVTAEDVKVKEALAN